MDKLLILRLRDVEISFSATCSQIPRMQMSNQAHRIKEIRHQEIRHQTSFTKSRNQQSCIRQLPVHLCLSINDDDNMDDFLPDIDRCLEVLACGGVILYPTDTVWGLGCDATNAAAVEKIFAIKQRPEAKSLIVLLAGERDVLQYVAAPDLKVFDYLDSVTKPTTVIYEGIIGLAENLLAADGSAGIRIVKEPFCKHLIKRFRKPVVSTSANISGELTPANFAAIPAVIKSAVDYIVQYRQEDTEPVQPSAVIKWANGDIEVIRS
jgi:L-threonylcarbamoyladenylate synthase